jgi:hypothetical protein
MFRNYPDPWMMLMIDDEGRDNDHNDDDEKDDDVGAAVDLPHIYHMLPC